MQVCELFKTLGDPTRLRIILLLMDGEKCVQDMVTTLGISQSAISHQLSLLKGTHLIKCRKSGKSVFYSLNDGSVQEIIAKAQEYLAK